MILKQRMVMLAGFVKPEPLHALAEILGQPGVTPAVDRTFPLEEAADGMRALVSVQVRGKLVLRVDDAGGTRTANLRAPDRAPRDAAAWLPRAADRSSDEHRQMPTCWRRSTTT